MSTQRVERELLEDDAYWSMSYVETTRSVELDWKSNSETMASDDFKRALHHLADHLTERHATGTLVDVRQFQFRMTADLDGWRAENIVPAYNRAGLKRFAYLLPRGSQARPGGGGQAASFETEYFDDPDVARGWLSAA